MKRYACGTDGYPYEAADGEFVRFADAESWGAKKVQSLIDEREDLKQALTVAHASGQKWMDDYMATRAINVRLQGEVDRLKAICDKDRAAAVIIDAGMGVSALLVAGSAQPAPAAPIVPHEHRWSAPHDCGDPGCVATGESRCLVEGCEALQPLVDGEPA